MTFMKCWTNVEDVWPALYKLYTNVLCLLGHSLSYVKCPFCNYERYRSVKQGAG